MVELDIPSSLLSESPLGISKSLFPDIFTFRLILTGFSSRRRGWNGILGESPLEGDTSSRKGGLNGVSRPDEWLGILSLPRESLDEERDFSSLCPLSCCRSCKTPIFASSITSNRPSEMGPHRLKNQHIITSPSILGSWASVITISEESFRRLDCPPPNIRPPNIRARSSIPTPFSSWTIATWLKNARR